MRSSISALIGLAALVATGALATQPGWRWPALPPGVQAPVVPQGESMNAIRVALGRRLFYDKALSMDGSMACADCHQQSHGFSDGLPTHVGVTGEMGVRNVPGLANVGWRTSLTWTDAGIHSLEAQAMVPMTGIKPVEMGMDGKDETLTQRLSADACYRQLFALAFPGEAARPDFRHTAAALGAFQRTMISFGSAWDKGKASPLAHKGGEQFRAAGCAECHSGPNFTDDQVHYVGTAAPGEVDAAYGGKPPPPGFEPPPEQFRTPSLRNVAVTGPWLHDGRSDHLDEAIRRHAASKLVGVEMPALLAFLESLTDQAFLTDRKLGAPPAACPVRL